VGKGSPRRGGGAKGCAKGGGSQSRAEGWVGRVGIGGMHYFYRGDWVL